MSTSPGTGCHDCAAEQDHCHGTVVDHTDGVAECTEAGCGDLHAARHALVAVDCREVDALCLCGPAEPAELALAS